MGKDSTRKRFIIISNKKCFYEIQYYLYHPDHILRYKYNYIG